MSTSISVVFLVRALAAPQSGGQPATSSAPATAPTTTTAAVEEMVEWHREYRPAPEQARKRKALLLVVYFDPDAPACEAFQEQALRDIPTRRFLARFAAARLDVTRSEGKKRFQATGRKETPLTEVFTPGGELLDSIPGAVLPASKFRQRLGYSLAYWQAATTRPADAAAQWKAIQARLELSTRDKADPAIRRLLKLSEKKLPAGVTFAELHLARGKALGRTKPKTAREELQEARKLAPKEPRVAGEALIALGDLALRAKQYKKAHEHCLAYIKDFPRGPAVGEAYYYKALVELTGLDDRASAEKTLREFISEHPDDPAVVKAQALLESLP